MFREIVKAKAVQLADCENLASEYLFYHSGSVYRPLWTYVVEAKALMLYVTSIRLLISLNSARKCASKV